MRFTVSDDDPTPDPSVVTLRGADAPRAARLAPGDDLLGRYTVLEELGQGAMGVVYKCLDRKGGIEVAVKCLPPEVTRNRGELDEIRENYQIVAKLHHEAISGLRYLENDPETGDYYVVMDLAEGEDLSRVLRLRRGRPMPVAEALEILRPLAAALDYAHGEGVLHRDVKPANVKVRPASVPGGPPCVQLLDFGLAAQVRSSMSRVSMRGHAGTSGTPAYMAPEQWEARRQGAATDQYALAVMAYEMLSGAPPFEADDTDLLRRAVLSRVPDPVERVPEGVNVALRRALAKDPKDRFPSCKAFVEALGRRGGSSAKRPWRLALVAAALLAAVAGALWFARSRGGAEEPGVPARGETSRADFAPVGSPAGGAGERSEPEGVAHAESAAVESHAESAESADSGSAPSEPPRIAEDASPRPEPAPSVPDLPPEDASTEDLEAARVRFADALEARRAEGWPDDSAESASLLEGLSSIDDRIVVALEAKERAEREAEAARLEKLAKDARRDARTAVADRKARESIRVLQAGAARDAKKAEAFRGRAGEGEFKARFETLDRRKAELDGLSKAADLAQAQAAASDVRVAADWIADGAAACDEIDETGRAVDALVAACDEAEAGRYAKSALYRARTARDEAERLRARGEFSKAKEKLESAKAQYGNALASAKTARAAAKAKESLAGAEAAKIREDWSAVLAAAEKALEWEPGNAAAAALKTEAEKSLRPKWLVSATLPGGAAATGATLALGGRTHTLPARLGLEDGKSYGPGEVTLEKDGKTYVGTLERTTVDWKGERKATVALVEKMEPNPGDIARIDLGSGVSLEMVACPGVAADFWMGKYEVTQEQWQRVMESNPSHFKGTKKPVETVSWNDCQEFIRKLNALPAAKTSGLTFRLPTEEEWETACRAGAPKSERYCKLADGTQITESNLSRVAWFGKNLDEGPTEVGKNREPNAWGLYDMHGNVWEWTQTADGGNRVLRGGSFILSAGYCTAGNRGRNSPDFRFRYLGFRLAASGRTAAAPVKPEATASPSDGKQAARSAAASRSEEGFNGILNLGSGVSLEMVHCPGVTPDFWMGKFEVTQEQWKHVMGSNPSHFKGTKKPVETVSWNDCQEFVEKLNELPAAKASGLTFRLPTEEEWETACRAGAPKSERYCKLADGTQITGSNLSRVAWFGKKRADGPTEVGKNREPNAWGLYDMHGNVCEWTQTAIGDGRVCRDGCFFNSAGLCTAGDRSWGAPGHRDRSLGFRLAADGRQTAAGASSPSAPNRKIAGVPSVGGHLFGDERIPGDSTDRSKEPENGRGATFARWGFSVKEIDAAANPDLAFWASDGGLFVSETAWGGNAERAGIKENDILRGIGGKTVATIADATEAYAGAMDRLGERTKIQVVVDRRGRLVPLTLDYTADPDADIFE